MPALRAHLYADPAAHSLSPAMFAAAFAAAGIDGEYRAVRVSPAELPAALERLRAPGMLGANLSLPHKEAALELLDVLSPGARAVGAVNTVVSRGGELHGHNTDVPGLLWALREHELLGEGAAVVLGAGGAARAAVEAARQLGRAAWVVNRSPARAEALAADFRARGAAVQAAAPGAVPWEDVGLVVNASAAGMNRPEETPLPAEWLGRLSPGAGVYDMVYATGRPVAPRLGDPIGTPRTGVYATGRPVAPRLGGSTGTPCTGVYATGRPVAPRLGGSTGTPCTGVYAPHETRLLREAGDRGLRVGGGLSMLAAQAAEGFARMTGRALPVAVFLNAAQNGRG